MLLPTDTSALTRGTAGAGAPAASPAMATASVQPATDPSYGCVDWYCYGQQRTATASRSDTAAAAAAGSHHEFVM